MELGLLGIQATASLWVGPRPRCPESNQTAAVLVMSELLKINVNEHVEKKNGLSYLSWAWAWAEVLKIDPAAEWHPQYFGPETNQTPYCLLPDGSMMVGVRLTIKGNPKQCLLPVMDHRNKAIKNPDAFAVNTALMRCLAKCIAMHGLGLYIYAGEDLPESDEKPAAVPLKDVAHSGPQLAYASLSDDWQQYADSLGARIDNVFEQHGAQAAKDALEEAKNNDQLEVEHIAAVWSKVGSKARSAIKALGAVQKAA